jgi:hypothetical protein
MLAVHSRVVGQKTTHLGDDLDHVGRIATANHNICRNADKAQDLSSQTSTPLEHSLS